MVGSQYNHPQILSEKEQGLAILMMYVWNKKMLSLLSFHFLENIYPLWSPFDPK